MSVFGKIKNVLFTEEEETEEIPVIKEEVHHEVKEVARPSVEEEITRFKNFNYEEQVKVPQEEVHHEVKEVVKPSIEERSPFQQFDEEEFDRIAAINKSRLIERDRKLREAKEHENKVTTQKNHTVRREIKPFIKDQPKFKPSPVISPVYGILDKNYSKDDILPRASSDGTLPKIMDVDKVRQKAFGTLESLEKSLTDDLDDIKITSFEDQVEENNIKIIEDEVEKVELEDTKPLPKVEEKVETREIPNIESEETEDDKVSTLKQIAKEEEKNDEKLQNDLFELIDSMYQNEEGE